MVEIPQGGASELLDAGKHQLVLAFDDNRLASTLFQELRGVVFARVLARLLASRYGDGGGAR